MKRTIITVAAIAALMLLGIFVRSRSTNGDQPPQLVPSQPRAASSPTAPYPSVAPTPPAYPTTATSSGSFQSQSDRLREQYVELAKAHAALLTADALGAEIQRLDQSIAELVAARDVQSAGDILREVLAKHPDTAAAAVARNMLDASATAGAEEAPAEADEADASEADSIDSVEAETLNIPAASTTTF